MTAAEHTAAWFTQWITNALAAKDVAAAVDILRVMAAYHPEEADEIRQTMLLGLRMAKSGGDQ